MDLKYFTDNVEEVISLLSKGGDQRLLTNKAGRNSYGVSIVPLPNEYISLSSSTGSSINGETFFNILHYYASLCINRNSSDDQLSELYKNEIQSVRDDLRSVLGLENKYDIVIGPSGTDLEMIPNFIGLLQNKNVVNIMSIPSETGGGTFNAASIKNFSSVYPDGSESLENLNNMHSIETIALEVANEEDSYKMLQEILDKALKKGSIPILRLVWGSKLGRKYPTLDVINKVAKKYKDLVIVADCCQGRLSPKRIRYFLSLGWIVNFTGSKFFSAPPFCGCLVFPPKFKELFHEIPKTNIKELSTLRSCFTRYDFPKNWSAFDFINTSMSANFGLLLRWKAAIYEMRRFFATDITRIERVIDAYIDLIKNEFKDVDINVSDQFSSSDNFSLLDDLLAKSIILIELPSQYNLQKAKKLYESIQSNYRMNVFSIGQPAFSKKPNGDVDRIYLRIGIGSRNLVDKSGLLEDYMIDEITDEVHLVSAAIKQTFKMARAGG